MSFTIFKNITIATFESSLNTEEQCLAYLAQEKWKDGYSCRKCGNQNYCKGKTAYSRRCTRCKHVESPTAHTMFHRCHLPLNEAFKLAFTVCSNPNISSHELGRLFEMRQMTCWKLKKKIEQCLESGVFWQE